MLRLHAFPLHISDCDEKHVCVYVSACVLHLTFVFLCVCVSVCVCCVCVCVQA